MVLLAHGAEEQRGDDMVDRIFAAGSSKQEIYQQADLIGRMYIEPDGTRWISFDPTAGSFGKNCGIEKRRLQNPLVAPHQLADIIEEARVRINEGILDDQEEIDRLKTLRQWIDGLQTPEAATEATKRMNSAETPAKDIDKRMLWEHCKRLKFVFSRKLAAFFASEADMQRAESAPAPAQAPKPAPAPAAAQPAAAPAPQPEPPAAAPAAPAAPLRLRLRSPHRSPHRGPLSRRRPPPLRRCRSRPPTRRRPLPRCRPARTLRSSRRSGRR